MDCRASRKPPSRSISSRSDRPAVGTFPVSAIAMSVGLNVTLTSYHERMDFGFVGNGATMYDLPLLARHVEQAYRELRATARLRAARERAARGPRPRKTSSHVRQRK